LGPKEPGLTRGPHAARESVGESGGVLPSAEWGQTGKPALSNRRPPGTLDEASAESGEAAGDGRGREPPGDWTVKWHPMTPKEAKQPRIAVGL
jgi:hypothetical protein